MSFNVNIHLAEDINTPAFFHSVTTAIHVCVDCLNRHEVHRCDGTRRHYWDYCDIHAPAYEAGQVDNESLMTLAELREGILHQLIRKPPPQKVARPNSVGDSGGGIGNRHGNHRRPRQSQGEYHDPGYSSYMNDNKVEPIWPIIRSHYKHADGCIHGGNVEFKAFRGETLVQHSCGNRDQEAKVVLQQDKDELTARAKQNFWEMQKRGQPTFKRSTTNDGIRVYFKRCNGQFVDIDGYALPTTIDDCDANTTIIPTLTEDVNNNANAEDCEINLLDTENELFDLSEPIKPKEMLSGLSRPSLIQDTDGSLEILDTNSWKEAMNYYATDNIPHHSEEWAMELESILTFRSKEASSLPLLPDFAPELHSHKTQDENENENEDENHTTNSSPVITHTKCQTKKSRAPTKPEPKVSLLKLMSREQSVYCNHDTPDSLIVTMYHWNNTKLPGVREEEASWRRQLYISGNLANDPLLEKR